MCGIFFSIGFEQPSAQVIDSVAHRGPDGRGWNEFISPQGPVIMAHRRLAIVDLSSDGHQPMASEDGRYWVTYNGEIYNYLEIKKELEDNGYYFKTKTDTEILLKSYIYWGTECLHKFNGMFAFVIWDDKEKIAFAARDRFGVKPIYYYKQGEKIAFASEIKQFTYLYNFIPKLEKESVFFYLLGGYVDYNNKTFFQNVFQLDPGYCFKVSKDQNVKHNWYDLYVHIKINDHSQEQKINKIQELLLDSIRLRLRSDVRVGSCLSGGIDSSSIVGGVSAILPQQDDFYTFSACFPYDKVDESYYIDCVTKKTKFTNNKVYPDYKGLIKEIDKLVYYHDQPIAGGTVYAQWCLFKKAKELNSVVMLDGQGSDEIFAGYHSMLPVMYNELLISGQVGKFLKELYYANKLLGVKYKTNLIMILELCYPKIAALISKFKNHYFIPHWIKKDFIAHFIDNPYFSSFQNLVTFNESIVIKNTRDLSLLKMKYTLPSLLHFEDRNSMAHSVESRTPFLDYRLVEYVLSLSVQDKLHHGTTKTSLREAMKAYLPDEVYLRKDKLGFSVPDTKWAKMPEVKQYIQDIILLVSDNMSDFIDRESLFEYMNKEAISGSFYHLWNLFDLGLFLNKFGFSNV